MNKIVLKCEKKKYFILRIFNGPFLFNWNWNETSKTYQKEQFIIKNKIGWLLILSWGSKGYIFVKETLITI